MLSEATVTRLRALISTKSFEDVLYAAFGYRSHDIAQKAHINLARNMMAACVKLRKFDHAWCQERAFWDFARCFHPGRLATRSFGTK